MASGLAEWLSLMVTEVNRGSFDLRSYEEHLASVPITGITDCKSLYDAVQSPSSPASTGDERVAIDLSIIKQCQSRTGLSIRWCPTQLMIADGLAKDLADPSDLLRTLLAHGTYQLSNEASVLALKKEQRDRRAARRAAASSQGTPICEEVITHNASRWPEPDPTVGKPLRRVSRDRSTGQILSNQDLTQHELDAAKGPSAPVPCMLTEFWYLPHCASDAA